MAKFSFDDTGKAINKMRELNESNTDPHIVFSVITIKVKGQPTPNSQPFSTLERRLAHHINSK